MENNQEQQIPAGPKKKPLWKWKAYLVLFLLLASVLVYGYFWVQQTNALREEAVAAVAGAEKFDILQTAIQDERARCENFISQQKGDFGSFEYCKKFIDWANSL